MKFKEGDRVIGISKYVSDCSKKLGVITLCLPNDPTGGYMLKWDDGLVEELYREVFVDKNFRLDVERMRNDKFKDLLG